MVKLVIKYEYRNFYESYSAYLEAQADFDKLKEKLGDEYFDKWMKVKDKIGDKIKDPDWVRTSPEEQPKFIHNPDRKYKNIYDILKFDKEELEELKDFLDNFQSKASKVKQDKSGAKLIAENDKWKVYRITSYPAAIYYGSNTEWCITGRYPDEEGKGEYWFNSYIDDDNLDGGYYFFINKNDDREKYCLLQGKDKQIKSIWDSSDRDILPEKYSKIPQAVYQLVETFPKVKEIPDLENIHITQESEKLLKAVKEGNLQKVKECISLGADVNYTGKNGYTPLLLACYDTGNSEKTDTEIAKYLLAHGAYPNGASERLGGTPLEIASKKNREDIVRLLFKYGAKA